MYLNMFSILSVVIFLPTSPNGFAAQNGAGSNLFVHSFVDDSGQLAVALCSAAGVFQPDQVAIGALAQVRLLGSGSGLFMCIIRSLNTSMVDCGLPPEDERRPGYGMQHLSSAHSIADRARLLRFSLSSWFGGWSSCSARAANLRLSFQPRLSYLCAAPPCVRT